MSGHPKTAKYGTSTSISKSTSTKTRSNSFIDPRPIHLTSKSPIPIWITPKSPSQTSTVIQSGQIWRDWIDLSTFHGVVELGRLKYGKLWKATWISVMITFTALAIFNIKESISQYISNPTVQNYQEQPEYTFPFPDIAVCTNERLNFSVLRAMGAPEELIGAVRKMFEQNNDPSALLRPKDFWEQIPGMDKIYNDFRAKNRNISFGEIQRRAGFKCEEIVKDCTWEPYCCCKGWTTSFLDRSNGLCHRFKTGQRSLDGTGEISVNQTWPGADGGVKMAFNALPGPEEGLMVEFIHPNETNSFTYFKIPPGMTASVQLSLQVTERINMIGRPQTCFDSTYTGPPCQSDGSISLDALRNNANGCYYATWALAMNKSCGCTSLPFIAEMTFCEPYNPCQYNQTLLFAEYLSLRDNCLPQCYRRTYTASISFFKFNLEEFLKKSNQSGLDENVILLEVYYPRMESLHIMEVEVYSPMTLVSNIGGALGLWLGASLMSILQMVFYCCKWVSLRKNEERSAA